MKAAVILGALAACTSPPAPVPIGPHYTYMLDHVQVPSNNTDARLFAFDLNGDKVVDNNLGSVFATATGMGFDTTASTQHAVDAGTIALIADLQTPDLDSTEHAGFTFAFGEREAPGAYTIAADSPADAPAVGSAANNVFSFPDAALSVRVAFMDPTNLITLPLEHAHVELDSVSADRVSQGVVCGAVPRLALDTLLLPSVTQAFEAAVKHDCGTTNGEPCGCVQGSLGATIVDQFDTAPDCVITEHEIVSNDLIISLLAPDLTFDGVPYVSFGLGFSAVATRLD
jgi:hypothetical protein